MQCPSDTRYVVGPLESIEDHVKQVAAIRIDLMLIQGDLLLMRSKLDDVHAVSKDVLRSNCLKLKNWVRSSLIWSIFQDPTISGKPISQESLCFKQCFQPFSGNSRRPLSISRRCLNGPTVPATWELFLALLCF